jgi:translation initiation factor IF-2
MPEKSKIVSRQPIVSIMGHVDHGKSTLLDYIRKSNIVAGESVGITQHIAAYEVMHETKNGDLKKITFLDTPGHAAFTGMRVRGATAADIAILVVSAEDGVKAQTLEALEAIKEAGTPYIVAINKIDKPGANIDRTKNTLLENGIYLEGMGGDISWAAISAKTGEGIDDLLDLILFVSEFHEMRSDLAKPAHGLILESHLDPKRGITATLIIKDGTLKKGTFIVAGNCIVPTRIMENFMGKPITEAYASSPVNIAGFDAVPDVGCTFEVYQTKKEAEKAIEINKENSTTKSRLSSKQSSYSIPLIIKADVVGSIEAIEKEINKINNEETGFQIISTGVGNVTENDLKLAITNSDTVIVGFNVNIDRKAEDLKLQMAIKVELFDIIYKLTEWLETEMEARRPRKVVETVSGSLKILKYFSQTKEKQVIGCKVENGSVKLGSTVRVMRRDNLIATGKITEMQHNKSKAKEVFDGDECGLQVETKITLAVGDILESITSEIK